KEARKFGKEFTPWQLYKYVSGVNAVKLRKLLSTLEGEDYPSDPRGAFRQLRQATLTGTLEIPDVNLESDIGGYEKNKKRRRAPRHQRRAPPPPLHKVPHPSPPAR